MRVERETFSAVSIGRRALVKMGAGASATASVGTQLMAMGTTPKIALEEHFASPELDERGLVAKPPPARRNALFAEIERRLFDLDEMRLEAMDRAGIDLCVLSVTIPGVQGEKDTQAAIELARVANDRLARHVQKRPQRYAGFAHLPMQDAAAAATELQRCIKDLGFKGALINGQTNGHYLDEERYFAFWERVEELDVPIYLHPGLMAGQPAMFADHPELTGPIWGWSADTGAHALRLVFGGTFKRFPRLKIILGHMGETLPFFLWRFDSRFQLQAGGQVPPDALPSAIIKRHFLITTSGVCDPHALADAIAAMGEDSVMFSVDYPYEDSQIAAAFIESASLSEAQRDKICHGNAKRLLRL
jgi:2,3-dihydroxybenzoate decarboxylase